MDYQGNYFPEDRDERESKIYRRVKGAFKWTMYGISFLIYIIIFYVIFSNRDSKILDDMYFTPSVVQQAEEQGDDFRFFCINASDFMNYDGTVQLYHIYYAEDCDTIEIGVKVNTKKLTDGDSDGLRFVLSDSNGNTFEPANIVTDAHGKYAFARVCFENVDLKLDLNDLRYERPEGQEDKRENTIWYFSIKHTEKDTSLETLTIYKNNTVFTKADFEPQED